MGGGRRQQTHDYETLRRAERLERALRMVRAASDETLTLDVLARRFGCSPKTARAAWIVARRQRGGTSGPTG